MIQIDVKRPQYFTPLHPSTQNIQKAIAVLIFLQIIVRLSIILKSMEHRETLCESNIKYAKITLKKRQQLVQEVLQSNKLISKAAKRLNLRLSTAKLIIKRYKEEGTFFESKTQRDKRLEKEEKTAKQSQGQGKSPVKQKLQNSLTENHNNAEINPVSLPQVFYYENPWMQPFPFAFPMFQGLMFYPF